MLEVEEIKRNIGAVLGRIEEAAYRAGRDPQDITLISVGKTFGVEVIERAIEAGATDIGENYVQEAREKIGRLGRGARWHFIGHLQRNKAKYAVRLFDLIHSVDSLPLAQGLDSRAEIEGKVQDVLVQVNISREEQKSGVSVENVIGLVREISSLKSLKVMGLMGMPPFGLDPEVSRPYFKTLSDLRKRVEEEGVEGVGMAELSMGMSGDYWVAVEEGATMVRVGTAIFGSRG